MSAEPSVLIVAGEASADLHGASLVAALRTLSPSTRLWGAGGAAMRSAGFEADVRAERIAVAGLTEILTALPRIWRCLRRLERLARERRPAVIVLIDLPDFNLRLARRLRSLGIPIVYYISPQLWAWREKRVEQIRALVDQMLCILPFEQSFYERHGVRAQFVGHPLVRQLAGGIDRNQAKNSLGLTSEQGPVLALLPGSRPKEVSRHLPPMLEGVKRIKRYFPNAIPVIPVASTIQRRRVQSLVDRAGVPAVIVDGQAVEALAASDVAVVCSGTATLQAALLGRPMVVVYRVSWLTYQIVRRLVRVSQIALVNLIAGRAVVPELVQDRLTPAAIDAEVRRFLEDPLLRIRTRQGQGAAHEAQARAGRRPEVGAVTALAGAGDPVTARGANRGVDGVAAGRAGEHTAEEAVGDGTAGSASPRAWRRRLGVPGRSCAGGFRHTFDDGPSTATADGPRAAARPAEPEGEPKDPARPGAAAPRRAGRGPPGRLVRPELEATRAEPSFWARTWRPSGWS
jgi:lipid-A-disaccharide synthase